MIDYTLPLDRLPDPLPIEPLSKPFDVTITPPGSKSITCRAYILAALAEGESQIIRPLRADDTDTLLNALCTLGAEARWDGEDVFIKGVGGRFPRGGKINLGDGGAPTRFMIAAACLAAEPVVVDASPRMRQRPIAEGVEMLRQLGAKIEYIEQEGRLPVRTVPSATLVGGPVKIGATKSSQFVSAVMLIAPWLKQSVQLVFADEPTSERYVRLTSAVLREWDVRIQQWFFAESNGHSATSSRPPELRLIPSKLAGRDYPVEPDASSAAYWMIAAGLVAKARVELIGMRWPSPQPDVSIVGPLREAGVDSEAMSSGFVITGPDNLHSTQTDARRMPDGSLALAALMAMATGRSVITGLHTLRVKETDRIAALTNELQKIGCEIEDDDDMITIDPHHRHDKPVVIETYNDHRMAMAFAVLGLARPGISIKNPACVSKSYPTFWKDFAKLYQ
ncbi:MAG: 3-phosphoshikimate 1-carboxyvinyltransferase [Planctomycetota bacterium]|nr:3-phosphoshikimate 1-carboxyvinyltransferase [Planctomycetota bacterium]